MSLTNPNDFKTLISYIPKEKMDKLWFFPIRQNKKNPDVSGGTVLKGNLSYRLSPQDCIKRLKWGKNVGIYALSGGLMFLDLDVKNGALIASLGLLNQIEPTLTVKSRNGGYQYYYWNNGEYPNQIIKENGETIGELRTDWYYVVCIGSYVTPDEQSIKGSMGTYQIVSDRPINEFKPFGDYFKKNDKIKKEEIQTFSKDTTEDNVNIKEFEEKIKQSGKVKRELSLYELNLLKIRSKRKGL